MYDKKNNKEYKISLPPEECSAFSSQNLPSIFLHEKLFHEYQEIEYVELNIPVQNGLSEYFEHLSDTEKSYFPSKFLTAQSPLEITNKNFVKNVRCPRRVSVMSTLNKLFYTNFINNKS